VFVWCEIGWLEDDVADSPGSAAAADQGHGFAVGTE
jgi:hypothetical protein